MVNTLLPPPPAATGTWFDEAFPRAPYQRKPPGAHKMLVLLAYDIANPKRLAHAGPNEEVFVLPHLGPEGLTRVDARHIVVVNDNNFPFSSGRRLGKPDDNELTLLDIGALVDAK